MGILLIVLGVIICLWSVAGAIALNPIWLILFAIGVGVGWYGVRSLGARRL